MLHVLKLPPNPTPAHRPRPAGVVRRAHARRGFTLIEVLVVLAIMVIVFGLLFAPMIGGMNLVTRGRRHVMLQDAVRLSLEQMKRDLAEAVYVFAPTTYAITSIDGQPVSTTVVDYSTLTFVEPARDPSTYALLTPLRPATVQAYLTGYSGPQQTFAAIRYEVHLLNPKAPYTTSNTFALFREQGYVVRDATGKWVWSGTVLAQNALSPRTQADIPPTLSVCPDSGAAYTGYVAKDPVSGSSNVVYITDAVQFVPQRVAGQMLQPAADGCSYKATRGGWLGTQDDGSRIYGPGPKGITMAGTELDPRLIVYRQLASGLTVYLDTYDGTDLDPYLGMSWDSARGTVSFKQNRQVPIVFPSGGTTTPYYPVTIGADAYSSNGTLSGSYTAEAYPIFPPAPTQLGDPHAPTSYVIDPTMDGALPPAKILPGSVRVRMRVTVGSGNTAANYYYDLEPVFTYDQDKIGKWQFCALLSPDGRTAQVRFNRYNPPSPDWFAGMGVSGFSLEIDYALRRNFNPANDADDLVRVDFSTRYTINVALSYGSYVRLKPSPANPAVMVIPATVKVHRIEGRDQVVINNAVY